MTKIKGSKTAVPPKPARRGRFRWSIETKSGDVMDKYNSENEKNLYCGIENGTVKVYAPIREAKTIGLTDEKGKVIAVLDVPEGAVAFQRRRGYKGGGGINYYNRFHKVKQSIPDIMMALVPRKDNPGQLDWVACDFDEEANIWISPPNTHANQLFPAHDIVKLVPEITYTQCWLIGWRTQTEVHYKCVYPDGKTEEYSEWNAKPWLGEPEWFPDEMV